MSRQLHVVNKLHLTAADPLDWDPWAALPFSYELSALFVKLATSPTTSEKFKVIYKPPTDSAGVAGVETMIASWDPSLGADDDEKQNGMIRINQRFAIGGIISVQYTNTDNIATINLSLEYDPESNM